MLRFVFFFHEESAYFAPNVPALNAVVVHSMFGEPLIVTLIFFRSGKMYFSESLVPAAYVSTNSKRMPFMDLLWALTFMLTLVSVPLSNVTTLSRNTWS